MESSVAVSPSHRFDELTKHINTLITFFFGVDIFALRLKFNYRTWAVSLLVINYTVFTVFSIFRNGVDLEKNLETSSMIGGLVHILGKFLTCLLKQQDMRRLTFFTRGIYEEYENKGIHYRTALHTNIDRFLRFIRIIRNGYFVTFSIMLSVPLAMLMYDGTRVTIMQFNFPGLSLESNFGFTATCLIHSISLIIGGVGFYVGDTFVFLGLTQIITFADMMQLKIDELYEALELKAKSRELLPVGVQIGGEKYRLQLLLEVIKWHQLFTNYCSKVNALYYELIASQVIAMAMSVLLSFCLNLSSFNLSLALYFVVSAYSMTIYCFLGTVIEFSYDQVYESICNVDWLELSVNERKLFGLMLRESQHPQTIQILGIMSLSMRTALQIVKLIYSVSMMMMNR
ncbi:putative odorant receptor 83c [Drosophila kikkawai]|uniref:Odorant receptor n=1 Tax=Drosophila kikkawai TaxID=30033 RepID=A0A6P4HLV5_DROKI|nr:putative odorant receptor 83c [Drosophila kikkawai]